MASFENAACSILSALLLIACAGSAAHTDAVQRDVSPASLYPLREGSAWSYDVDAGDGQTVLATSSVLRVEKENGLVEVRNGQGLQRYLLTPDGIKRPQGEAYLLRAPIAAGSRWPAGASTEAQVTAVGQRVKTPAGDFDACVVVEEHNTSSDQHITTTYCPGVGPVRVESRMDVRGQALRVVALLRGYNVP
jgi:hypothetical protein